MELTEELTEKLCSYVRLGVSIDVAVVAEGATLETLGEWIESAMCEKPTGIHSQFIRKIDQARAQGEILHIRRIVTDGGPKESQWVLERMYPEKWAQKRPAQEKKQTASVIDAAFSLTPKRIAHEKKRNKSR